MIAKASTTCTCSLDPITRASLFEPLALQVEFSRLCRIPRASFDSLFILRYNHYPLISSTSISSDASNIHYYFFQIVKDRQPTCSVALTGSIANDKGSSGCAHALVIGDPPSAIAPTYALKRQRGRGWWRQTGSNRRPPACKAGALPAELCPQAQPI